MIVVVISSSAGNQSSTLYSHIVGKDFTTNKVKSWTYLRDLCR